MQCRYCEERKQHLGGGVRVFASDIAAQLQTKITRPHSHFSGEEKTGEHGHFFIP